MKYLTAVFFFLLCGLVQAQSSDSLLVHRAALDYLEGFYEGDTLKLQRSLSPEHN